MTETLGDAVGECFLCGGQRRTWRSVAMCETCAAVTPLDRPHVAAIDELHAELVKKPEQTYVVPDVRAMSADAVEKLATARGVVLEPAAWAHVLLMAGADEVHGKEMQGGYAFIATCTGAPRRKTLREAGGISPVGIVTAAELFAIWHDAATNIVTPFERWLSGEAVSDEEMASVRAEALRATRLAMGGMMALQAIAGQCQRLLDDETHDWDADPWLCAVEAGKRWMAGQAESMAGYSLHALSREAMR